MTRRKETLVAESERLKKEDEQVKTSQELWAAEDKIVQLEIALCETQALVLQNAKLYNTLLDKYNELKILAETTLKQTCAHEGCIIDSTYIVRMKNSHVLYCTAHCFLETDKLGKQYISYSVSPLPYTPVPYSYADRQEKNEVREV